MGARRIRALVASVLAAGLIAVAYAARVPGGDPPAGPPRVAGGPSGTYVGPPGIHKIKHVIIVMQENRSFDSYFGSDPGADDVPRLNGVPAGCGPNPPSAWNCPC